MSFTVTREFAKSLLDPVVKEDLNPLIAACTPSTTFQFGAVLAAGTGHSGTYTPGSFVAFALPAVVAAFDVSSITREYTAIDVVGNKIIAEHTMKARTLDGQDYINKFAEFYEIDDEGKVKEAQIYMDSELQAKAHAAVKSA